MITLLKQRFQLEKNQVDKVPFPIVLDKDFTATDFFDIHSVFAHPSTYLIDKQGEVQFAYLSNDKTADHRPFRAIFERVEQLQK
ncbi:redoxin domain-containing protein [bacterium]|nr:redoxin domain-containing protein [bacterium]